MLLDLGALTFGVIIGTLAGLIPGMHSNLVASFLVAVPAMLPLDVVLIAMATTHLFVSIIPALYLSLPNENTVVSLLPGQQLVKEGRGYEGVLLHARGMLLTTVAMVPFLFVLSPVLPSVYVFISPVIPFFLMLAIITFLKNEQLMRRIVLISAAGLLGYIALHSSMQEPLFPLFSGLFGIPSLLVAASSLLPSQTLAAPKMNPAARHILPLGWISGAIVGFLPGVGTAHAASMAQVFHKKIAPGTMIALLSSLSCANFLFAMATSTTLGKARNGVLALLMNRTEITPDALFIYAAVACGAAGCAYVLCRFLGRIFAQHVALLSRPFLRPCLVLFIATLVFVINGWNGFLLLSVSTLVGMLPLLFSIERSILMSSLLVPVLILLWPF